MLSDNHDFEDNPRYQMFHQLWGVESSVGMRAHCAESAILRSPDKQLWIPSGRVHFHQGSQNL